jgi:hypothetical protein
MAYYEDNLGNGGYENDFIFLGEATVYPLWAPGTSFPLAQTQFRPRMQSYQPVYAATAANSGSSCYIHQFDRHADSSGGGSASRYGRQPTASQFGHHAAPFVGASGHSANTEATRALISNNDKVKHDGKSFYLPKLVPVNGTVADRERLLLQYISQIRLTNAKPSTKYSVLLYRFNNFPIANSAARSKMAVFDLLESTPLSLPI